MTSHSYTVFGDLFRATLPWGNLIEYGYGAAGRLLSVERKSDPATHGERVLFTLDAAGNRTLEELHTRPRRDLWWLPWEGLEETPWQRGRGREHSLKQDTSWTGATSCSDEVKRHGKIRS